MKDCRYVAQGGDWGSGVTTALGALDTEHCAAIHVTLAMGARPKLDGELSDAAKRTLEHLQYYRDWDSGYSKQQATRPQTCLTYTSPSPRDRLKHRMPSSA